MTTQIRQPYLSYPLSLLGQARAELRDGPTSKAISVLTFAERHGVKRTTVYGWKKKVTAGGPLRCKGAQRKLGPFEETNLLREFLGKAGFQSPDAIRAFIRKYLIPFKVKMSDRTIQRCLQHWGISVRVQWPSDHGGYGRPLLLWREDWCQPADTVVWKTEPLKGILWLLVTRKGMKGVMPTDDSDKAISRVIAALETTMTPRRRLLTNCRKFAEAAKSHTSWRVALIEK